jgi:acyl-CoA dehydrogenase
LLHNEEQRERLTYGMYMPTKVTEGLGRLENAYKVAREAEGIEKKVRKAVKAKKLQKKSRTLLADALKAGVITESEHQLLAEADRLRLDAIQVDDFSQEEYLSGIVGKSPVGGATANRTVAQVN